MLALLFLLLAAGAQLAIPIAFKSLIDEGLVLHNKKVITQYFEFFLVLVFVFGVFAGLRFYTITWLGERVALDLLVTVFKRVIRMDATFYENTKTGDVLSRLTSDITQVQIVVGTGIFMALRSGIGIVGTLLVLMLTTPNLTILLILLLATSIIPIILLGRRVRSLSRQSQDSIARYNILAAETLRAIKTVQAFQLENSQEHQFVRAAEDSFDKCAARARARALLTAQGTLIIFSAIIVVLWVSANKVFNGDMTPGELSQFIMYASFIATSFVIMTEVWGDLQRSAGATERLLELTNIRPNIIAPPSPCSLPNPKSGQVNYNEVIFNYPTRPSQNALESFSLEIKPGETVALVGSSGAGKSTALQLLLRFYDPQQGKIFLDGVDIATLDPQELRDCIAYVAQDITLFGTSIRENIRYGRLTATDAEIEVAAQLAAAHTFIENLPEKYDTHLGEGGLLLSGGQRQRIAIARAILRNPTILLLDEATSALDAESEQLVQGALEGLMSTRTTVVVAHKLSTVLKADRIAVMEDGRITEIGNHETLLTNNPLYSRIAELQFIK